MSGGAPDARLDLARAVAHEFSLTRKTSRELVEFMLDYIKSKTLIEDDRLAFMGFGTFYRRLVDHGRMTPGGVPSAPHYVLRFKRSDKARMGAAVVGRAENGDDDPFNERVEEGPDPHVIDD